MHERPKIPRRVGIAKVTPSWKVEDVEYRGEVDAWRMRLGAESDNVDGEEGLLSGFVADREDGGCRGGC